MANPIGFATLSIIPSFKGIDARIRTGIAIPLKVGGSKAGQDAGKVAAKAFADNVAAGRKPDLPSMRAAGQDAGDEAGGAASKAFAGEQWRAPDLPSMRADGSAVGGDAGGAGAKAFAGSNWRAPDLPSMRSEGSAVGDDAGKAAGGAFEGSFESAARGAKAPDIEGGKSVGEDAGGEAAEGFASKFKDKVKGIAIGGGVLAAAGFSKGLFDSFNIENANAKFAAQIGKTVDASKKYSKIAADVYRNAWGESIEDVNTVIGSIVTNLKGVKPNQMNDLSVAAIGLRDTFDVDVAESIRTVRSLIDNDMVPSAMAGFDVIAKGFTSGANKGDDLLETLDEYAEPFKSLGFDAGGALKVINQGLEAGAWNADKVGDAFKEFAIRAIDGSDASKQAIKGLGLNYREMSTAIAEGGPAAQRATSMILKGLGGVSNKVDQDLAGVSLFGSMWEDMGPKAILAMDPLAGTLGKIKGAATDMANTVGTSTTATFESFKRRALMGLANITTKYVLPAFNKAAAWITENWPRISEVIQETSQKVVRWVKENWPEIKATALDVFEAVKGFWEKHGRPTMDQIIATARDVVDFIQKHWDTISAVAKRVWQQVSDVIENRLKAVRGMFKFIGSLLSGDWSGVWQGIKDMVAGSIGEILATLRNTVSALGALGKKLIEALWKGMQALWTNLDNWLADLGEQIVKAFKGAPKLLSTAGRAILAGLWAGARIAWKKTIEWVKDLPGLIVKAWKGYGKLLNVVGREVIDGFWTGAKAVWKKAIDWVKDLPGLIVRAFRNAPRLLLATGRVIIDGLWEGAKVVWKKVGEWFRDIGPRIRDILVNAPGWLVGIGGQIVRGLLSGIYNVAPVVWGWFRDLGGRIKGFAANAASWLYNTGLDIIRGLGNGLLAALYVVPVYVARIPAMLWASVTGAVSWLYNAGRDAIQGFINGMQSKYSSALSVWNGIRGIFNIPRGPSQTEIQFDIDIQGLKGELAKAQTVVQAAKRDMSQALNVDGRIGKMSVQHKQEPVPVVFDVTGTERQMAQLIRQMVRTQGGGNVQRAFGT